MNISLNWLNDYIDVGRNAEALAGMLSDLGFPVEGIETVGDDIILEVEVTSNRGDCLGHLGVARELSVATGKSLRYPEVLAEVGGTKTSDKVKVSITSPELCGRYTVRLIEGVKVGPTPDWMRTRLEAVGLRSVNNVVDATNYALMETGQPPHAFDFDKIHDGQIEVRPARTGESLTSIDGTECKLTPEMLVIADSQVPVAIAGVMGGLDSEVNDTTTTILLEDAYFDPVCVRSTSRRLVLPSDAAYRFERIVDIENIAWASQRTADLIIQVAGGRLEPGFVDVYPGQSEPLQVTLRLTRLGKLLGIEVPVERVLEILTALHFQPQRVNEVVTCTVPTWRNDIYREVDLIEEVARCYGYDKIPTRTRIEIEVCPEDERQVPLRQVAQQVQACGYYEAITVDFVDPVLATLFGGAEHGSLCVNDSSRKGAYLLRQTLLGSLLTVLKTNVHNKTLPCRVYEISHTFAPKQAAKQPVERTKLALVADSDFRQLRTAVELAVRAIMARAEVIFEPTTLAWAEAGALIKVKGVTVGQAAVFSETVMGHMDIKNMNMVGAEIDIDSLLELAGAPLTLQAIPRYPAITRDLSVIIKEDVLWADLVNAVQSVAPETLESTNFVEAYRGKGIAAQHKSVTLSLCFRDSDGTLKHETVDGYQETIVKALTSQLQAELRAV